MGGNPDPRAVKMMADTARRHEVQGLRDALAFYADRKNWESPSRGFALQYDPEKSPVQKDWGAKAREALGE